MKHLSNLIIGLLVTLFCCGKVFAVQAGDSVVARNRSGQQVEGVVVELISANSKAVLKKSIDGQSKTEVVLVDQIQYIIPPIFDSSQLRTWKSANGKFSADCSLISQDSGRVYLQRRNGLVLGVGVSALSRADQAHLKNAPKRPPRSTVCSGDKVRLLVPNSTPCDAQLIRDGIDSSLKRSGYIPSAQSNVHLSVTFDFGTPEEHEMRGLSGTKVVKFTPCKTTVDLRQNGKSLWKRTHQTQSPYTLPAGQAGIEKLEKANLAMLPFLRTLGIPVVFR